jgi:hypothetical protein
MAKRSKKRCEELPILHPHAAGENVFHRCDEEALKRAQFRLQRQAAQLGFQLVPLQNG